MSDYDTACELLQRMLNTYGPRSAERVNVEVREFLNRITQKEPAFDGEALLQRMQGPEQRKAMQAAFDQAYGPSIFGTWPKDDIRRAFVSGAAWWEFTKTGGTIWQSDRRLAEDEAERRFPGGERHEST